MIITKYPDNCSYVTIDRQKETTIFKINSYEDLWHLNQFVDAFNSKHKYPPTVLIPNLIDAQADRRFAIDQSSGLKLVCKFLNGMNANFKIFHPHNPEVVEALMDNIELIDNTEFVSKVINKIVFSTKKEANSLDLYRDTHNIGISLEDKIKNNLILMSADAGGFKPLMKLCDNINWKGETYSASKYRANHGSGMKLFQEIDRQDFGGKDILIVDDICIYGGTFKGLAKLLKDRNCGKLYLACSHMTVQNLGEDPVTNYFDKVFTTNSKYDSYKRSKVSESRRMVTNIINNLEIIKLF